MNYQLSPIKSQYENITSIIIITSLLQRAQPSPCDMSNHSYGPRDDGKDSHTSPLWAPSHMTWTLNGLIVIYWWFSFLPEHTEHTQQAACFPVLKRILAHWYLHIWYANWSSQGSTHQSSSQWMTHSTSWASARSNQWTVKMSSLRLTKKPVTQSHIWTIIITAPRYRCCPAGEH